MSIVNRPHSYTPNTTISSSQANANENTLYNDYNGNISAANLATDAVTTAKIADSNVTTAKIADANVTTVKIADAAVTPAKWTNPYKFSVYKSSDQTSIGDAATTKVTFDTELFDTNNNFASSTYTVPASGFYQMNAYATYSASAGNAIVSSTTFLYKNGSELFRSNSFYSTGVNGSIQVGHINHLVQLAAGDTLDIYTNIDVSSGSGSVLSGIVGTRWSGFLVSET